MLNLLNESSESNFLTRNWNIVNNQSNASYDLGNETIYNREVLKSNLCDYNDAYTSVKGNIITTAHNNATPVAFKNCAKFTKCITKIDGITIDNAEDLYLVTPMCNLIEYSSNYSNTTGSLWFYSKDEAVNLNDIIANIYDFKSFRYKAKLLENSCIQK